MLLFTVERLLLADLFTLLLRFTVLRCAVLRDPTSRLILRVSGLFTLVVRFVTVLFGLLLTDRFFTEDLFPSELLLTTWLRLMPDRSMSFLRFTVLRELLRVFTAPRL